MLRFIETSSMHAPRPARRQDAFAAAGLLIVVLVTHGSSLWDGAFFDDHWHRDVLRDSGWRPGDHLESATVVLDETLNDLWWQNIPMRWRYARPVSMLVMKFEHALTGGDPRGLHAFAIAWHAAATLLVYFLAVRALHAREWAFAAATLFAINPHSVFAVGWLAAHNAEVSAVFFLAAVLCWVWASPAPEATERRSDGATKRDAGTRGATWGAVTLLLWGLALLSRETAIIFPLVALLVDLCAGGIAAIRRRIAFHVVLWLATGIYLYWRLFVFPSEAVPSVYFDVPSGAQAALWAAGRLVHLLFATMIYTPMFIGMGTYEDSPSAHLVEFAVMTVIVAAGFGVYVWASRGRRDRWLWPAWVVAAYVPVIPAFVSPHFAYLPFAAYAILVAIVLQRVRGRWRPVATVFVIVATAWSFGLNRFAWRGIVRSEQLVMADIRSTTPAPVRDLFFINLPVSALYAPVVMRTEWNERDVRGHVLTFADHWLVSETPCTVERVGENELIISAPAPGFFAGRSGQTFLHGVREGPQPQPGDVVHTDEFDVTVLDGDQRGFRRLRFSFGRPLDSPQYAFYLSSPERPAYRLTFEGASPPADAESDRLFERARAGEAAALAEIRRVGLRVAVQTGDPIRFLLTSGGLQSDGALEQVEAWWRDVGAGRIESNTEAWNAMHHDMRREQAGYFAIFDLLRSLVRSDVYMTGD